MILRVRGRAAEAVALLERSEMRLELARALLDAGEHERARDLATRIGARRIARLAGATPSAVELSPEERRVAGLAADGLDDREIAEALWVTHRTVEQQLAGALEKLGVTERGALGRALALL
jgi:DNA-binding NarL/FixJ family response regulator